MSQDEFGEDYFSTLKEPFSYKETEFEYIMKLLPPEKGDKVLDMGCGKGQLGSFLQDKCGCNVTFADVSPEAKKYLPEVVIYSMTDTPFEDNSFDKIYSLLVISHIDNADRALAEMHRISRGGGLILLTTTNKWQVYISRFFHFLGLIPFSYHKTVKHLWSQRTFKKLLKSNGWKIKSFSYEGKYPWSKLRFNFFKTRLVITASKV